MKNQQSMKKQRDNTQEQAQYYFDLFIAASEQHAAFRGMYFDDLGHLRFINRDKKGDNPIRCITLREIVNLMFKYNFESGRKRKKRNCSILFEYLCTLTYDIPDRSFVEYNIRKMGCKRIEDYMLLIVVAIIKNKLREIKN